MKEESYVNMREESRLVYLIDSWGPMKLRTATSTFDRVVLLPIERPSQEIMDLFELI